MKRRVCSTIYMYIYTHIILYYKNKEKYTLHISGFEYAMHLLRKCSLCSPLGTSYITLELSNMVTV